MTSAANSARRAATVVALLFVASAASSAQVATKPSSSVGAPSTPEARTPAEVEWMPAQPRQGSVVRITIRPRLDSAATAMGSTRQDSIRIDSTGSDSARSDSIRRASAGNSLPAVSIAPGARVDSLRAVLDTLAIRRPPDSASTVGPSAPADTTPLLRATLFGEPLHFRRETGGEYTALAAIPVDAPTSVSLAVIVADGPDADTITARLPIRRTVYKMEKLKVAPRFGQAPDSALAARIAREQALAAAVSRQSHTTPRLWDGEFQRPRAARVTSAFGDGREFNGKVQSRHMGLDLAGAIGAPVLATNRGVVALVGEFYYAGNAVYIDHGAGLVTAYFHLSAVEVAQGDTVTPGSRIGLVGATGRVTGPHLHWVARYGAVTVDPSTLLDIAPADSQAVRVPPARRDSANAADSSRAIVPPPSIEPRPGRVEPTSAASPVIPTPAPPPAPPPGA